MWSSLNTQWDLRIVWNAVSSYSMLLNVILCTLSISTGYKIPCKLSSIRPSLYARIVQYSKPHARNDTQQKGSTSLPIFRQE